MRACGECSAPCRRYGSPIKKRWFIDQVVICVKCGWCGVETVILDEPQPVQVALFQTEESNDGSS